MIGRSARIAGLSFLLAISLANAQMFSKKPTPPQSQSITSEPVFALGFTSVNAASGSTFILPSALAVAPDGRIFVGETGGRVYIVQNGSKLAQRFIDLSSYALSHLDRALRAFALVP